MTRNIAIATIVFALTGMFFAGFATLDFAEHLDRQVHGIHCSFLPGVEAASASTSGCQVTLMSRYSSVLRTSVWGGIPVSLPGLALFAFLGFWGSYLLAAGAHRERQATTFTLVAWLVPLLTSCVMGYLAIVELDAVCKLCIGIYSSSALGFVSAALLFRAARSAPPLAEADATIVSGPPTMGEIGSVVGAAAIRPATSAGSERSVLFAIPLAGVFIFLPVGAYVAAMPDYSPYERGCGDLPSPADRFNVFVPLGGSVQGRAAIEVLDPLCPSCKGLEGRLAASGLDQQLYRKALLFPLDTQCNWMVGRSIHPGACAVSEAMLCEPEQANAILEWAFANQEAITSAERAHEGSAARMVTQQFASVRGCVGSTRIGVKLQQGLRWAVSNQLPVLTPQLFVEGRKVCNEDTDLGLEYMLSRMLETSGNSNGGSR